MERLMVQMKQTYNGKVLHSVGQIDHDGVI